MKNSMTVPQKLTIELRYDSPIPFLSIYPEKLKAESRRNIYTSVLITFTVTRSQKEPKYSSVDKYISKIVYRYKGILLSLENQGKKCWHMLQNMDEL